MAIYVKFAEEKRPKSIKQFLTKFYTKQKNSYCAVGVNTFSNKECTHLQSNHMYRSFDDLLELTKTYYPSTTTKKFLKILLNLKIKVPNTNEYYGPHLGTCSTMGKIRYIPYITPVLNDYDLKMKNSKYTWKDLLEPLEIENTTSLKNYLKKNEK